MPIPLPRLEWPKRSCREPVWSEHLPYTCELADEHRGPCASNSVAASLQRREAWEAAQEALQSNEKDQSA